MKQCRWSFQTQSPPSPHPFLQPGHCQVVSVGRDHSLYELGLFGGQGIEAQFEVSGPTGELVGHEIGRAGGSPTVRTRGYSSNSLSTYVCSPTVGDFILFHRRGVRAQKVSPFTSIWNILGMDCDFGHRLRLRPHPVRPRRWGQFVSGLHDSGWEDFVAQK